MSDKQTPPERFPKPEPFDSTNDFDEVQQYMEQLNGTIPAVKPGADTSPFHFSARDLTKDLFYQQAFQEIGMYALVTWKWLTPFAAWLKGKKVLEVMSGRGWIAKGLRELDVDIRATGYVPNTEFLELYLSTTVTDVEPMEAVEAVKQYGGEVDVVIMSWPPMDRTAYQVLRTLHEVNPQAVLVYIGELGGCTADRAFMEHFVPVEDEAFYEQVASNYETWGPLHDHMMVGRYSAQPYE